MSDNILPFRRRDEKPQAEAPAPQAPAPEANEEWTIRIVAKAPPTSR